MAEVSARHALNDEELEFCKVYLAFGERDAAEAYRRSHLVRHGRKEWYFRLSDGGPDLDSGEVNAKSVAKLAAGLLKQEHIQTYLLELRKPAGDRARQVLHEQALWGEEKDARAAASAILADEDKLGFRDAVLRHAEILCEAGATVEVALPTRFQADVVCPECGHTQYVDRPLSVEFPLSEMFPQFNSDTEGESDAAAADPSA